MNEAEIQCLDYQVTRKYWKVLKGRFAKEGSELVTNCYQLKMTASDGKQRLTNVATAETLLRHFPASDNNLPWVTR